MFTNNYKKLTIIIPTKDRPKYVISILDYYNENNYDGFIILADSSEDNNFNLVSNYIKNNKLKFSLLHVNTYNKDVKSSINFVINKIDTLYTLQISDDDFLIMEGLNSSIKFLDKNNNYIGCQGRGLLGKIFFKKNKDDKNTCSGPFFYRMGNLIQNTPQSRIYNYIDSNMNILFAMFHSSIFKELWQLDTLSDNTFNNDFIIATRAALIGKIGFVNKLYCIHIVNASIINDFSIENFFSNKSHQNFDLAVNEVINFINHKKILIKNKNLNEFSESIFIRYIHHKFNSQYKIYFKNQFSNKIFFLYKNLKIYFFYKFFFITTDYKSFKKIKNIIEIKW